MSDMRVLATDLEFPEGPVVMPDGTDAGISDDDTHDPSEQPRRGPAGDDGTTTASGH